ncbi:glutamate racemase [Acinetobacter baumannii]|uniref:glutamate racemase n=1 Tax=Acinetobacter baumannii TaxID=470 RepID=UPI0002B98308|nr:glutamate racemase [Acinetobacter baumannii]EIY0853846.1 glutamate racemase [Acinetobacter baumannii]MDV7493081.1 glutamate racemase [Acinetobacter baumannii]MDV7661320.1 glutamate racemase [Acinetobacter baumannii]OBS06112.1 glutamate racemase [Acinetobacter baumannii]TPS63581.1 glutamate racemase [Acinetobacter baumannii]
MNNNNSPIGMIDSGLGGLSLFKHIREALPNEDIIYFADSKYVPYGDRESDWIVSRTTHLISNLVAHGKCKAIMIACNTMTAVAVETIRAQINVPLIAIEPAVKPAVAMTVSKHIAVLATATTVKGKNLKSLIETYAQDIKVSLVPCIGLAEKIETGKAHTAEVKDYLKNILAPLVEQKVDTIILGCTHYPFVSDTIQEIVGRDIQIIEPSEAVTAQLIRQLNQYHLNSESPNEGNHIIWTSSDPLEVADVTFSLLSEKLSVKAVEL